jgi:DNA repair ATPase RecN
MELATLKIKLLKDIKEDELERFFSKVQKHILDDSDLQGIFHLLASRTQRLKLDLLRGTISDDNKNLENNTIISNLIDVVEMVSENDLKIETVETSVASLLLEIENRKKEFQNIVDDKSKGLIRIGQNLINLGGILSEKPSPDDVIPYEEKIKIGTIKGARRIKIGFLELKELKNAMLVGVQKIEKSYTQLVTYLDFPKEKIGEEQLAKIKTTVADLQSFIKEINPDIDPAAEQIGKAKSMFEQVLPFQDQLGAQFEIFFESAKEIIVKCDDVLVFSKKNNNALTEVKNQLKNLLTELQLNIQEKEI